MINVANIIEEGKLGGPQIRITNVANSLSNKINTTVILPIENADDFVNRLEDLDVNYKQLHLTKITKELNPAIRYIVFSFFEIIQLKNYFKRKNFDIIHVSGGSWQYKGVIAGYLAGVKVLWHLNDTSMPYIFRKLFIFFSRFVDGYIYASRRSELYYGKLLKQKNKKPSFVIQAPVNTIKFDPKLRFAGDGELIQKWGKKMVIGTIANINRVKGLDNFIDSIIILNKTYEDLIFIVIGQLYNSQKHYFNYLKKVIKNNQINNLFFVGQRLDIKPLLNRIDIYVCSSKFESSPISIWEAMSMEKPIVSTDVGDVKYFVRTGHSGFIAETNNPDNLAMNISKLITNKKLRIQFGKRNRSITVKKLDIRYCAMKHLMAYEKIIYDNK